MTNPAPSKQRVLIALRSFGSLAAAARSIGCGRRVLQRMAIYDDEIRKAYQECASGAIQKRKALQRDTAKRQRKAEAPRVSVRTAERRKARLMAAAGLDPRIAAATLHKRLNHEKRQEKMADLEEALEFMEELRDSRPLRPVPVQVLRAYDRWCASCKSDRLEDPCEVCNRHTVEYK